MSEYVAPSLNAEAFNCPHCEVYARQYWNTLHYTDDQGMIIGTVKELSFNFCEHCSAYSLWLGEKMLYPVSSIAPLPAEDMPENVKGDYLEARSIVNSSPRAATALLRLALQKLMISLKETGKNLDADIGNLVKKGLPVRIQEALGWMRVIGNNAVQPGEIDLKDHKETALSLFNLLNIIVNVMITQPKEVNLMIEKMPKGAKGAMEKSDNP